MLGVGGKFASAKGMVRVPDLSGLTAAQCLDALNSFGLVLRNTTSSTIADPAKNGRNASQSISPNTLVDYETSVDISIYQYVEPAPPPTPTFPPKPSDDGLIERNLCVSSDIVYVDSEATCDGTTKTIPAYRTYTRTIYRNSYVENYSTYSWDLVLVEGEGFGEECQDRTRVSSSDRFISNSTDCINCSQAVSENTFEGANSNCASGQGYYITRTYADGCTPSSKTSSTGCVPVAPVVTVTSTDYGTCGAAPAGSGCSSGTQSVTTNYSDGTSSTSTGCCTYTPPKLSCTASTISGTIGACSASGFSTGQKCRDITVTGADCTVETTQECFDCWQAYCDPWSAYNLTCSGNIGASPSRTAECISSVNGNRYTKTEYKCCTGTTDPIYGTCTSSPYGRYKSKTTTTYVTGSNGKCTANAPVTVYVAC